MVHCRKAIAGAVRSGKYLEFAIWMHESKLLDFCLFECIEEKERSRIRNVKMESLWDMLGTRRIECWIYSLENCREWRSGYMKIFCFWFDHNVRMSSISNYKNSIWWRSSKGSTMKKDGLTNWMNAWEKKKKKEVFDVGQA